MEVPLTAPPSGKIGGDRNQGKRLKRHPPETIETSFMSEKRSPSFQGYAHPPFPPSPCAVPLHTCIAIEKSLAFEKNTFHASFIRYWGVLGGWERATWRCHPGWDVARADTTVLASGDIVPDMDPPPWIPTLKIICLNDLERQKKFHQHQTRLAWLNFV